MVVSFDIFRIDKNGPVWRGAASTLDEAKQRVQALAREEPGEYMIANQRTGERLNIRSEPADRD